MRYVLLGLLLIAGCSKETLRENPLNYSFMPKYLDFDSISIRIPPDLSIVVDSTFQDYNSIPVYGGLIFNGLDSLIPPSGVLISEKKAALFLYYQAEYKRLITELKYARYHNQETHKKAKAAETLYQEEIIHQRELAKRTLLEKNIGYLGFAAGVFTVLFTEWAVINISDR